MDKREEKLKAIEEMGKKRIDNAEDSYRKGIDSETGEVTDLVVEDAAVSQIENSESDIEAKIDENLAYITSKFNQDGLTTPEGLSADRMRSLIAGADAKSGTQASGPAENKSDNRYRNAVTRIAASKADKPRYGNRRKTMYSIAACFLAVVLIIPAVLNYLERPPVTDMVDGELRTFANEREIKNLVASLNKDVGLFGFYGSSGSAKEDTAISEEAAPSNSAGMSAENTSDHSETYTQVEGVDEADIIKTDGKYIYIVTGEREVVIYRADEGKTDKVASISGFQDDTYISDMYIVNDKLVLVGISYDYSNYMSQKSVAMIYDISDPEDPVFIKDFSQSGYVLTSRVTGGKLYLITKDYASNDHYIPFVTGPSGYVKMAVENICTFPNPSNSVYVVVSAVDIDKEKKVKSISKAIFGNADNVYCNTENLFIAGTDYRYIPGTSGGDYQTQSIIAKVALNDGKLRLSGTGRVRGYIYDQWALDEKDGYLRVATTSSRNGRDVNNLFVLDENLEQVGEVTGFARNEHIEAVRFMGDKGYVITFERTDPLFILDLADPRNPKIEGEVEIEGFSTLLVPTDPGRLVGIGYSTDENEYGGIFTNGIKLALFDISNPSEPKVLDSINFTNASSQAQFNHKALLQNKNAGYLAIPYSYNYYDYGDVIIEEDIIVEEGEEPIKPGTQDAAAQGEASDTEAKEIKAIEDIEKRVNPEKKEMKSGGVLVFKADNKFDIKDVHELGEDPVSRCVYIGDYIYAINDYDDILSFKIK